MSAAVEVSAKRGCSVSGSSSGPPTSEEAAPDSARARTWGSRTAGRRTSSTASRVCATTCSMSSCSAAPWIARGRRRPPGRRPRGGPTRRRSAPARPRGRASRRRPRARPRRRRGRRSRCPLGVQPGDQHAAEGSAHAGLQHQLVRDRAARSSASVVATRLPAQSSTRGFSMRMSITSRSSPSRPTEVTPTRRPRSCNSRRAR